MTARLFLPPALVLCMFIWPCASASPPPPPPVKEHVQVVKFFEGITLGPGASGTWFGDDVHPWGPLGFPEPILRYFMAVPVGSGLVDNPWVDNDQSVEVTNVFYILKGESHARDGSGGQHTYQINVTVKNRDNEHPVTFNIYMAEFK